MAHIHRFHVTDRAEPDAIVTLCGHEAHHALNAVRVRPGDAVRLFDGQGWQAEGTVARSSRREVEIEVTAANHAPPPQYRLVLLQAGLNREAPLEELIRRCTEIGVTDFVFFRSKHSDRPPKRRDKWDRWAIESCKQCGRLWLPTIEACENLEDALDGLPAPLLVATAALDPAPLRHGLDGMAATIAVGPEGDFHPDELALLRQRGGRPISLGPTVLRSEAAAVVASTLVLYEMGMLG